MWELVYEAESKKVIFKLEERDTHGPKKKKNVRSCINEKLKDAL